MYTNHKNTICQKHLFLQQIYQTVYIKNIYIFTTSELCFTVKIMNRFSSSKKKIKTLLFIQLPVE